MNLTGRPVNQKPQKRTTKGNQPTKAQRLRWGRIALLGCIVGLMFGRQGCKGRTTIHHCCTGAGGRKDHDKVIGLCVRHHTGEEGIDSTCIPKPYSKRGWQDKYGSEQELMQKTEELLRNE